MDCHCRRPCRLPVARALPAPCPCCCLHLRLQVDQGPAAALPFLPRGRSLMGPLRLPLPACACPLPAAARLMGPVGQLVMIACLAGISQFFGAFPSGKKHCLRTHACDVPFLPFLACPPLPHTTNCQLPTTRAGVPAVMVQQTQLAPSHGHFSVFCTACIWRNESGGGETAQASHMLPFPNTRTTYRHAHTRTLCWHSQRRTRDHGLHAGGASVNEGGRG